MKGCVIQAVTLRPSGSRISLIQGFIVEALGFPEAQNFDMGVYLPQGFRAWGSPIC